MGALSVGGSGRVEFGSRKGMEPDWGSDPAPDPGNCSAVSCELLPDTGNRSLRGWERHLLPGETEPRCWGQHGDTSHAGATISRALAQPAL